MVLFAITVPVIKTQYFDIRQRASGKNFSPPVGFKDRIKEEYIPGEVVVKFKNRGIEIQPNKDKQAQGANIEKKSVSFSDIDTNTLPNSLKNISEKYQINTLEKVFKEKTVKNNIQSSDINNKNNKNISHIYKISIANGSKIDNVIDEFRQNQDVEYAEPNYIVKANFIPNDPYYLDSYPSNINGRDTNWNPSYDYQWSLKKIGMENAWDLATGSASTIVAVVDTGIDYTHQEFGGCNITQINNNQCNTIVPGYDFINNDNDPADDNGHGTHVSGTIAAISNNSSGISGINPYSKIMSVKALDNNGSGSTSLISQGIVFAADNGAKVINMSFGTSPINSIPQVMKDALDYSFDKNVVLVAAAGNSNDDVYKGYWPAKYNRVISVSSTNENDQKATYSNYGKVDVAAPGGESSNILSLNAHNPSNPTQYLNLGGYSIGNGFLRLNGTSMATPHVSGVASLLIAKNSSLPNLEVKTLLEKYSDDLGAVGYDQYFGSGKINAQKAMTTLVSNSLPPFGEIYSPERNNYMGGIYNIVGTVGGIAFSSYQIDIGYGDNPSSWKTDGITLVNNGNSQTSNDILATINTFSYTKGYWMLRLRVNGNNNLTVEKTVRINIDPDLKTGWPKEINAISSGFLDQSYFLAADLDNDGKKEIIAATDTGYIYAWKSTGELLPGWPKYLGGNYDGAANSVMSISDLNKDGKKEIAIRAYSYGCNEFGFNCIESNSLHLLNINGSEVNSSWPKGGDYVDPVIEDINNDGTLDVISYNFADNKLYIFSYEGDNMNYTLSSGGSKFLSVGDIDVDGKKEVVFAKESNILVYKNDGTLLWSKSVDFPETQSADVSWAKPTLADIDGDGKLEVIAGSGSTVSFDSDKGKVWVFKYNGNNASGWPQKDWITEGNTNRANVAVGDVDNDGMLELVWGTNYGRVLIYGADGNVKNILYGESASSNFNRGIALTDINNDGIQEILAGSSRMYYDGGAFFAWDYKGNSIAGWPKNVLTFSTPQITDIDNDGKTDIVIYGKENLQVLDKIYIFGLNTNYSTPDWSMYGFNEKRTGSWSFSRFIPTATPKNTPTPTPKPVGYKDLPLELGKAVKIASGNQNYIEVPISQSNNSLNIQGSMSAEMWINFSSLPQIYEYILSKRVTLDGGGSADLYSLSYRDSKDFGFPFLLFTKTDITQNALYNTEPLDLYLDVSNWYHLGITYNDGIFKAYINGQLIKQYSMTKGEISSILDYYLPLIIGQGDSEFKIDELRISDITRNIQLNWQNNTYFKPLISDQNTMALWHFENNLEDISNYKNNGLPHGTILYINGNTVPTSTPTPAPTSIPTPTPFVCTACKADINTDGRVNAQDYVRLTTCWGKAATDNDQVGRSCLPADINGSGTVDQPDYNCLQSVYSQTCSANLPTLTPTPTFIPTPTPFVCTACAADIKKDSLNRVNAADYAVLASCYGKSLDYKLSNRYICANADVNKDGKINESDYS
ncbi:MAG: S8 family serine peptidase, partial [Candidatus Levybacteria bacterium]|nr:S8 family serine peptidase [Candidatus Levybacteria bacterium]